MFNRLSRSTALLAVAACVAGLCATALIADVPADYKGKPWKDTAQAIPGKVMLAYYDEGGEGVGYHAAYPRGGGDFRNKDGISPSKATHDHMQDTGKQIPGYYVGWTAKGQWMQYTVDVQKAGTYTVNVVASSFGGGQGKKNEMELGLSVNGVKKGAFTLAETSDYHNYKLNSNVAEVTLEKGKQLLKVTIEKEQHAGNLLYVEFVEKGAATAAPKTKAPKK